ncbi:MAG: M1 family aminopeptidase, partial [Chloroflexota bacterium]
PTLPPPTDTPAPLPTDTPTPDPASLLPNPHYTLNVTLDYRRKRLAVDETILYPNATGESLRELVLSVMPNYWPSVFKLTKLEVNQLPITNFELEGQRLTIPLEFPLVPEAYVELRLAYSLVLPQIEPELDTTEIRPQFFGYTDKQMNLVNWYPFIVPRDADGWLLHDPWYFGEHLVYDVSDFEVNVKHAEEGIRPVIAASAAGEPNGEWTRFILDDGRAFAFSAGTEFRRTVTNAGNVFVYSYYFPQNETPAKAAAAAAADAVEVFSQRFGPYPHPTLTIVMSDFNDGAEFSAFFFLSKSFYRTYDSTRANYLTFISAHETAHQWWFEQVANDQYLEPWLDEALSAYSEHIFYETTDWPLLEWWWTRRVDAYAPHGYVDIPLDTPFEDDMYRQYVNAVYLRGAQFLDDLRTRMGDEAFFAFLQDYLNQFKGKRAAADDFFAILRQHTDADISDLVSEYFQGQH